MAILNNPMGALAAVNRASGITTSVRAKAPPGRAADGGGAGGKGGGQDGAAGTATEACQSDADCAAVAKCEWVNGLCFEFHGECQSDARGNYCLAVPMATDPTGECCQDTGTEFGLGTDIPIHE